MTDTLLGETAAPLATPPASVQILLLAMLLLLATVLFPGTAMTRAEPLPTRVNVGYLQEGDASHFQEKLLSLVDYLDQLGLIKPGPKAETGPPPPFASADRQNDLSNSQTSAREIWNWLADHRSGGVLTFRKDAFYETAWNSQARLKMFAQVRERLERAADLELLIALGDWTPVEHHTLTELTSLILLSHLDLQPTEQSRQQLRRDIFENLNRFLESSHSLVFEEVLFFHKAVGFPRLGVLRMVPEHNPENPDYMARILQEVSENQGFQLVSCFVSETQRGRVGLTVEECIDSLDGRIDALYLADTFEMDQERRRKVFQRLSEQNLPTFSRNGEEDVRLGALMGTAAISRKQRSRGLAVLITRSLRGSSSVGSLMLDMPLRIGLNLDVAQAVGYHPSATVLFLSETLYMARFDPSSPVRPEDRSWGRNGNNP